jgi:membrane protein DedA with SNARE-associated domain
MIAEASTLIDIFTRFWHALQHGAVLPMGNWNYLLLFIFVVIQGTVVKLMTGAVVADIFLNFYMVLVVSICASLVADIIWFRVGTTGNLERVLNKRPPKQRKTIQLLQKEMRRHYFKIILIGKFSAGLTIPTNLAAGMSKLSWRRWLPTVMLGEVIYTTLLLLLGFFAASSIKQVDETLQFAGIGVTVLILLFLFVYLPIKLKKILREDNKQKEVSTTD